MKPYILALAAGALLFSACNGGDNATASGEKGNASAQTIDDPKLRPFMLGGVYFFNGYGGGKATQDQLFKGQMQAKPGEEGFLTELHNTYREYFYYPFKPEDAAGARSTLQEYWGITDQASFQKEMDDLLTNGHQASYEALSQPGAKAADPDDQERLAFINAHKAEFPKGGIKAWDLARYVNNVAMGYAAGYVTQAEGDAMLAKLPAMAKSAYAGWDEYWKGYNLGRKYWAGDPMHDAEFDKVVAEMMQGDYSLYKYMPW